MQLLFWDFCFALVALLFFTTRGIKTGLLMQRDGINQQRLARHKRSWKFAYSSLVIALIFVVLWTESDLDPTAISPWMRLCVRIIFVVFVFASFANLRFNGQRAPRVHLALNITIGTCFTALSLLGVVMALKAAHLIGHTTL